NCHKAYNSSTVPQRKAREDTYLRLSPKQNLKRFCGICKSTIWRLRRNRTEKPWISTLNSGTDFSGTFKIKCINEMG
ncbi:hypothetical protein ATANTOWER_029545, partial [Ataeniobius toweri]|nr:hypothetical protein [Ataeniobius toweri]